MGLISYGEDESDMFLKAVEKGFVQIDPRLIVDLAACHAEENVLQWCNEQWNDLQVITCIATYAHDRMDANRKWVTKEYHYVSRYFFKELDHAMLFKLVFSDGLITLPPEAYQLFLR
jgi:hypothetical protein